MKAEQMGQIISQEKAHILLIAEIIMYLKMEFLYMSMTDPNSFSIS